MNNQKSFVDVNGLQFYYEQGGSGPRLLYISGTGGDLRKKPNVFDSPLAHHFEILTYDQRGLGQSDKPDVAYTMADYADDAAGIMDAVGWKSALVMGVSFGGMVGQEFALRHPEKIEKLVLACTSSGGHGGASYPLHTLIGTSPAERARIMIPNSDTRCDATWQKSHAAEFDAMIDLAVEMAKFAADEPNHAEGARRQLEARAGHDTYERLPQLTMPVYVCGGKYDGVAKPENLEAITNQLPNARMDLFEGGHGFLAQDSAAYQAVIEFLNS